MLLRTARRCGRPGRCRRGAHLRGVDDRIAHHPALVRGKRDLAFADRQIERPLRDLASLTEEGNLDATVAGLRESAGDLLGDLGVLLAVSDERGERLLEGLEVELAHSGAVRRGARELRGKLDGQLAHAILGERAEEPIGQTVEDALDRSVVGALAEHRADGLDEVALDPDLLLTPALGEVVEAARDAVDADRVNTQPKLDELRDDLARDCDQRALERRLGRERHLRRRDLLLRHDNLRSPADLFGEAFATDDRHFRRPAENATRHMPARGRASVSDDPSAVVFADEKNARQDQLRTRHRGGHATTERAGVDQITSDTSSRGLRSPSRDG